jgi:hypothetical protein
MPAVPPHLDVIESSVVRREQSVQSAGFTRHRFAVVVLSSSTRDNRLPPTSSLTLRPQQRRDTRGTTNMVPFMFRSPSRTCMSFHLLGAYPNTV